MEEELKKKKSESPISTMEPEHGTIDIGCQKFKTGNQTPDFIYNLLVCSNVSLNDY